MQIIQPPSPLIDGLLKSQKYHIGTEYRLITYAIKLLVPEGVLLYNLLTKCIVLCQQEDLKAASADNPLIQYWFLVPEKHDDQRLCEQIRSALQLIQKKENFISGYCIFTTTVCNARCFYCFERGSKERTMNDEIAAKVVDYIAQNACGHQVRFRWFGGEPLYNMQAIDNICDGLKRRGVDYVSKMVSNGYLFNENVIKRAATLWKLDKIQITLDGTEEKYNRIKNYKDNRESAYLRVMKNIGLLLEYGIRVVIRLNIDAINIEDMTCLVHELHTRYGGNKLLSVYSRTLFENKGCVRKRSNEERALLCNQQIELEKLIYGYNLNEAPSNLRKVWVNACMADTSHSITILPDGKLGKCNDYLESHFVGTLDEGITDEKMVQAFTLQREPLADCRSCALQPDCLRLQLCMEKEHCYVEERRIKVFRIQQMMLKTFEKNKAV